MSKGDRAPHVANIDFPEFYAAAVGGLKDARAFYDSLSNTGSEARRIAKIILHQAGRMVWLGDQLDKVARGRPALQIMFFIIAAEAVAKLAAGVEEEGRSQEYVHKFFATYCTNAQRERLYHALREATPHPPSSVGAIVDYLYEVRCDVVHRGKYFDVNLPNPLDDVRAVILEAAVLAARKVSTREEEPNVPRKLAGTDARVRRLGRHVSKQCVLIASSIDTIPPELVPPAMREQWLRELRQAVAALVLVVERLGAGP